MATVKRTQDELRAELESRFGPDPMRWAFTCPGCGDTATGLEIREALQQAATDGHPNVRRDGTPKMTSDVLGQQCIGRLTGALDPTMWKGWTRRRGKAVPAWKQRGCDWAAGGLFSGPEFVVLPDGSEIPCFPIAPAIPQTGVVDGVTAVAQW